MSTLTDVINAAFRESGITAVGASPNTAEAAEALPILINLINSIYSDELGEYLTPYNVGSNGVTYGPDCDHKVSTIIPYNSRLHCSLSSATTLYLPPTPPDGCLLGIYDTLGNFATYNLTLNGNGRKINSAAVPYVLNTNNYASGWIYYSHAGWMPVTALSAGTDLFPFPLEYFDMVVIMLAMRLNPRYGAATAPESLETLKRLMKRFKGQYKQPTEVESENGLLRLSSNPYTRTVDFTKGR